jgi:hypothetical protein
MLQTTPVVVMQQRTGVHSDSRQYGIEIVMPGVCVRLGMHSIGTVFAVHLPAAACTAALSLQACTNQPAEE